MSDVTAASVAALLAGVFLLPANVRAFSGSAAADYADLYATSRNSSYYAFSSDCASFASQALRAGGYPWRNFGASWTDNHNWWFKWSARRPAHTNTRSWSFAADQRSFLIVDVPGGVIKGQVKASTRNGSDNWRRWPSNIGLSRGDLLYFDWGQGEGWSHVAILAAKGSYTSNGWYGDLVDAHNSDRYHAHWDLSEHNNYISTTKIEAMHIAPGN